MESILYRILNKHYPDVRVTENSMTTLLKLYKEHKDVLKAMKPPELLAFTRHVADRAVRYARQERLDKLTSVHIKAAFQKSLPVSTSPTQAIHDALRPEGNVLKALTLLSKHPLSLFTFAPILSQKLVATVQNGYRERKGSGFKYYNDDDMTKAERDVLRIASALEEAFWDVRKPEDVRQGIMKRLIQDVMTILPSL